MNAPWTLDGYRASLHVSRLQAELDVRKPAGGLSDIHWDARLQSGLRLACAQLPHAIPSEEPVECYLRGGDLIATYRQTDQRRIQTQVYWRALETVDQPQAAGVELILSTQTNLFDVNPELTVANQLPSGEVLRLRDSDARTFVSLNLSSAKRIEMLPADGSSLVLVRPADTSYSLATMVHPSDFQQARLEIGDESACELTYRMFTSTLEKGVIRRGRMRAVFLPRENDEETAIASYLELVGASPPLTA